MLNGYKHLWQMLALYIAMTRDTHEKGTSVSSMSEDNWTVSTCNDILKKMKELEESISIDGVGTLYDENMNVIAENGKLEADVKFNPYEIEV